VATCDGTVPKQHGSAATVRIQAEFFNSLVDRLMNQKQQIAFSDVPEYGQYVPKFEGCVCAACDYHLLATDLRYSLATSMLVDTPSNVAVTSTDAKTLVVEFVGRLANFSWDPIVIDAVTGGLGVACPLSVVQTVSGGPMITITTTGATMGTIDVSWNGNTTTHAFNDGTGMATALGGTLMDSTNNVFRIQLPWPYGSSQSFTAPSIANDTTDTPGGVQLAVVQIAQQEQYTITITGSPNQGTLNLANGSQFRPEQALTDLQDAINQFEGTTDIVVSPGSGPIIYADPAVITVTGGSVGNFQNNLVQSLTSGSLGRVVSAVVSIVQDGSPAGGAGGGSVLRSSIICGSAI
jgi:hypothetical protein